jgi:hypothetical protein
MAKQKKTQKHHKPQREAGNSARLSLSSYIDHKRSREQPPRQSADASGTVVPYSIDDVARLFIGDAATVEKLVKTNSTAAQHEAGVKRRHDVPSDVLRGAAKKQKRKAASRAKATMKPTKPAVQRPTAKGGDNEEEEDVALSREVQAQTLSFLQHLNPHKSKVFWGLRKVAQGKGTKAEKAALSSSAADAAAAASSSSPSAKAAHVMSRTITKKKYEKKSRALADDGEELWRVGGPYIPSDEDDEEEEGEAFGYTRSKQRKDGGQRNAPGARDMSSSSSVTSSEPSWLTDSSEEDDDETGEEVDPTSDSSDSEGEGGGRDGKAHRSPHKGIGGGGGRLFQGGDDIWDDDDD